MNEIEKQTLFQSKFELLKDKKISLAINLLF